MNAKQSRRGLLAGGAMFGAGLAGCLGSSDPELSMASVGCTEPRFVAVDHREYSDERIEYLATVQNTGIQGEASIDLHFVSPGEDPDPTTHQTSRAFFFDENERREIGISEQPPSYEYEYVFESSPTTYVGVIENDGAAGDIEVTLIDAGTEMTLDSRETWIGEGERRSVEFQGPYGILGEEYVIEAEPI